MGQTLTRAAQWTTTSSGSGRLESTSVNESVLKEILDFVENFSSKHPDEAELEFEEPLQWSTTLERSDFEARYEIRLVRATQAVRWCPQVGGFSQTTPIVLFHQNFGST